MIAWLSFALLAAVLIPAAIIDWRTEKVPNHLTFPAIAAGLLFWAIVGLSTDGLGGAGGNLLAALLGFACGFVPFAILWLGGGIGGGDVKLMGAVGAISASWQVVLSTAVYGLILAAVWAVALMIRHGMVRRTLGRIWSAALHTGGGVKAEPVSDSPTVPFAAALAVGGIVAGFEQLLGWQSPWAWLSP